MKLPNKHGYMGEEWANRKLVEELRARKRDGRVGNFGVSWSKEMLLEAVINSDKGQLKPVREKKITCTWEVRKRKAEVVK